MKSPPLALAASVVLVACGAALTACGAAFAPDQAFTVTLPGAGDAASPGDLAAVDATDPVARPGMARRFLRLPRVEEARPPMRVAMQVPASWGIRARDAGGRVLRPCEVSPSSPSELFVQARPQCDSPTCPEHERLTADLARANIIYPGSVESAASESRGPLANITRLKGHFASRQFVAFRFVRVDKQSLVPVACEAFLLEDEIGWLPAYEAACASLAIAPVDWQDGPDDVAPAPDGRARTPFEEAAMMSARSFVTALGNHDRKTASMHLYTSAECVASGGPLEDCESGAESREEDLALGLSRIPAGFTAGSADVRFPATLMGLAVATVKRRGDPCGPGYEVTLAKTEMRYAVVSADPMPDPGLLP